MPKRLDSYEKAALRNTILKGRSVGVAAYTAKEALEWGTTGAGLRATGIDFDVRKWRPYSGYENFDFEVPTGGGRLRLLHPRDAESRRAAPESAHSSAVPR